MELNFPSNAVRPYCRLDGRTGAFALSVPDGDPEIVEMKGKLLDLDIAGVEQGWLRLDANGVDWQPLAVIGDWKGSPRPSADHNPGVRIDLMSTDWPAPNVRELRASSHAVKSFVERVALAAGDIADGKAVRVQLTGARVVKIGKGSSVDIGFDIAPPDRWPDVAAFDAHRGDDAAADGASANFADMPDSPLDGPVGAAADEWA